MKQFTKYAIDSVVSMIVRGLHSTKIGRIIIDSLINNISVKNKKGSNLIEIIFSSVNAGEAS